MSTLAGGFNGTNGGFADGTGSQAGFNELGWNFAVDTVGHVYFADRYNHRLRKVTPVGGAFPSVQGVYFICTLERCASVVSAEHSAQVAGAAMRLGIVCTFGDCVYLRIWVLLSVLDSYFEDACVRVRVFVRAHDVRVSVSMCTCQACV